MSRTAVDQTPLPTRIALAGLFAIAAAYFGYLFHGLYESVPYIHYYYRPWWPEPVEAPWISGRRGWAILFGCAAWTAVAFVLRRRQARPIEPLLLVAVLVAALGTAEAIHAIYHSFLEWAVDINLTPLAYGLLITATALAVAAFVRVSRSRGRTSGEALVGLVIVCCFCQAWALHRYFATERGVLPADGIVLPSCPDPPSWYPHPEDCQPILSIRADGSTSFSENWLFLPGTPAEELIVSAGAGASTEGLRHRLRQVARGMKQEDGRPDSGLAVRADREAPWWAVRRVFLAGSSEEVNFRWSAYLVAGPAERILGFVGIGLWPSNDSSDPLGAAPAEELPTLRIEASGTWQLNDRKCTSPESFATALQYLRPVVEEEALFVRFEIDLEAPWGAVTGALDAVMELLHTSPIRRWGAKSARIVTEDLILERWLW